MQAQVQYLRCIPPHQPTVLAVDGDSTLLCLMQHRLKVHGYHILTATNGDDAFNVIEREADRLDAVLLDCEMPGIKGLEVARMVQAVPRLSHIPIIMQTLSDRPGQIEEGIEAGVFYYLTKPIQPRLLLSLLRSATVQSQRYRTLQRSVQLQENCSGLLDSLHFTLQTLDQAAGATSLISHCFPEPARVMQGIFELMVNAIEHGNLNISHNEKTRLLAANRWAEEIERRLTLTDYRNRRVRVAFRRAEHMCCVEVTDEGEGFDWRRYLSFDPARAMMQHGRGIAQANHLAFDRLSYNEKGNQVTGAVCIQHKKVK